MDSNDRQQRDKNNDDRSSQGGSNFIWYVVALSVGVLLLVTWLVGSMRQTVRFSDLVELVKNSKRDDSGHVTGHLDTDNEKGQRVRYSNLRDVKVGEFEVTGKIDIELLNSTDADSTRTGVAFRTHKSTNEESEKTITALLEKANIQWDYHEPARVLGTVRPDAPADAAFDPLLFPDDAAAGRCGFGDGVRPQPRAAVRAGGPRHHVRGRGRNRRGRRRASRSS